MSEAVRIKDQSSGRESKEPLVVKKIYQFTHPDYDSAWSGEGRSRGRHLGLRKKWNNAIDAIAGEPEAVLFYTSAFSAREFQLHASFQKGKSVHVPLWDRASEKMAGKAIERDITRILYAKEKLGDRFILLTEKKFTEEERAAGLEVWRVLMKDRFEKEQLRLRAILEGKNIRIPSQPIHCFGEYRELCVQNKGEELAKLLGMVKETEPHKAKHFVSVMPELSLSSKDPFSFKQTPYGRKN